MYQIKPHINPILYRYFRNKELDELYASIGIKSFAISLISIFIPIYLLTLGFSLIDVAIYNLIYYAGIIAFYPSSISLAARWGVKKTMMLGIISALGYFAALNYITSGFPYYIAAAIQGLSTALYWTSYHIEFTEILDTAKGGTEISISRIIAIGSMILGPIVGAFFILSDSFSFIFLLVSVLLIFAMLPLFLTKDIKAQPVRASFSKIIKYGGKGMAIASQAGGFLGFVTGVLWPVFIFLTLKSIMDLGWIVSATSAIMVTILFLMGRSTDRDENMTLKSGVILHSLSWISRLLFLFPIGVFINNFYASVSSSMMNIPFTKKVYTEARKSKNIPEFILFREFHLFVGRALAVFLFLLINNIMWMFIVASFVTFFYLGLITGNKSDRPAIRPARAGN